MILKIVLSFYQLDLPILGSDYYFLNYFFHPKPQNYTFIFQILHLIMFINYFSPFLSFSSTVLQYLPLFVLSQ